MSVDEWKQIIVRSAKTINCVATPEFICSHSDDEIRNEFNLAIYQLYYAAYHYQKVGGNVNIRNGDIILGRMACDTVDDVCPVDVRFSKNA